MTFKTVCPADFYLSSLFIHSFKKRDTLFFPGSEMIMLQHQVFTLVQTEKHGRETIRIQIYIHKSIIKYL